jgi:hypothetical protein
MKGQTALLSSIPPYREARSKSATTRCRRDLYRSEADIVADFSLSITGAGLWLMLVGAKQRRSGEHATTNRNRLSLQRLYDCSNPRYMLTRSSPAATDAGFMILRTGPVSRWRAVDRVVPKARPKTTGCRQRRRGGFIYHMANDESEA